MTATAPQPAAQAARFSRDLVSFRRSCDAVHTQATESLQRPCPPETDVYDTIAYSGRGPPETDVYDTIAYSGRGPPETDV